MTVAFASLVCTVLQDIALYGGLCALASFDRAELKSRIISNITFREFLELAPEVRAVASNPLCHIDMDCQQLTHRGGPFHHSVIKRV